MEVATLALALIPLASSIALARSGRSAVPVLPLLLLLLRSSTY